MDAYKSSIMVVAAHPDDEVLGCGGTISRLVREGNNIFIVILGEGITSRYDQRDKADPKNIKNLQSAARRVADLFGVKELFTFNFPDNRFDTVPLLDIVKKLEKLIQDIQPKIIYTHHGGDLNIDHVITFRAVLTATRPIQNCPVREIYAFEIPSSTEWAFGQFSGAFSPNVFMDIRDTLELKIKAMQIYETESGQFPHPRSPKAIQAIAQKWGSTVGSESAESFELVRSIR